MAVTTKKYVSIEKLGLYDEKIKAVISSGDADTLAQAKAHAESLASNYEAAGSVATAKAELEGKISAAQGAADSADAKAVAAQKEIDALETLVGELPEGTTASSVVDYVNVKTAGIATDAALEELNGQVSGLQTAVQGIQADYLVEADKTELSDAIAAEATAARAAEKANADAIKAIQDDYLKAADKAELQGGIDAVDALVDALIGEDTGKSARTIANEELAKQLIAEGAAEALDTLEEIAAWIQAHPGDAAAMNKAIEDLEALVGTLPEGVTATTIVGYIAEAVAAEKSRAEAAEAGLAGRISTLEESVGNDGSVADMIADAVAAEAALREAADAEVQADADKGIADAAAALKAAQDADAKAVAAQGTADANTAAIANKAAKSDVEALAGRVETAEGEIDTLQSEMDAVEALAASNKAAHEANASAIALKAAQVDLESEIERAQAAEKANADAIAAFIECGEEEINALFAAE